MKLNILKSSLTAIAALILTCLTGVAQTPVETHGRLRVDGNQIVGEHGEPVQLMGISHYWSLADQRESSAALKPGASTSGAGIRRMTSLLPAG